MEKKRSPQLAWMKNSALTLGAVFAFFVLLAAMRWLPLFLKSFFLVVISVNAFVV